MQQFTLPSPKEEEEEEDKKTQPVSLVCLFVCLLSSFSCFRGTAHVCLRGTIKPQTHIYMTSTFSNTSQNVIIKRFVPVLDYDWLSRIPNVHLWPHYIAASQCCLATTLLNLSLQSCVAFRKNDIVLISLHCCCRVFILRNISPCDEFNNFNNRSMCSDHINISVSKTQIII